MISRHYADSSNVTHSNIVQNFQQAAPNQEVYHAVIEACEEAERVNVQMEFSLKGIGVSFVDNFAKIEVMYMVSNFIEQ